MAAPAMVVTEDTPPDMLAGSMDLSVVLPDGHSLKMSVERSTPMMDLLVQVTTANKISPAGYILRALNDRGPLPYKPSTPIGALDTWTIHVVPKHHVHHYTNIKKSLKTLNNQPFEQTFRLQVHLPRNQLYVARVSPRTRLSDILRQVCHEKNLDPVKYSLRHPNNLDEVLRLTCTLGDYKLQEVTLVYNQTHPVEVSTVDIMSLQRDSTNPAFRHMPGEGSVSSGSLEGRSLSPAPSDESSASPPPLPPSRPTRKRRPAPKPPIITQAPKEEEKQQNEHQIQSTTVINHSRNSSDSSGYHEASVLSESPQSNSTETLRQHQMSAVSLSRSMTDVTVIPAEQRVLQSATSISSLSSLTGRKKKAAPPPPPGHKKLPSPVNVQQRTSSSSTTSSTTTLDGSEVPVKSATLPPSSRLYNTSPPLSLAPAIVDPSSEPPALPQDDDDGNNSEIRMADEEIDRIFSNATNSNSSNESGVEEDLISLPNLLPPPSSVRHSHEKERPSVESVDWEYRLPAPPTFRDETKSPSVTEFGTVTIANFSDVTCSKPLVEETSSITTDVHNPPKSEIVIDESDAAAVHVTHSESITSEENTEHISTSSCNSAFKEHRSKSVDFERFSSVFRSEEEHVSDQIERKVISELSNVIQKSNRLENTESEKVREISTSSTLENFKIMTYKDTKPLEVFEDDSVKSSTGEKRDKSKDDAVFRAPKARVKEPNLSRTSSFSVENKLSGPKIKRSVSYVSLLAANMPRNSQPYRAHLQLSSSEPWPQPHLRKTSSELHIHNQGRRQSGSSLWQDESQELQSVQVLRSILNKSQVNLTSTQDEPQFQENHKRNPPASTEKFEDANNKHSEKGWGRSQSEEVASRPKMWNSTSQIQHSSSLDQEYSKPNNNSIQRGQPAINLSTWNERPKRQVSIKNDRDYISGFGKKNPSQEENPMETISQEKVLVKNSVSTVQKSSLVKRESFKLDSRSKSTTDLSRIPIVRSVELKKPFVLTNIDNNYNKSAQVFESVNKNTMLKSEIIKFDDFNNNDDVEQFIGVDSLAKRFGLTHKRPVSMFVNGNSKVDLMNSLKSDHDRQLYEDNTATIPGNQISSELNELHIKITGGANKLTPTSEVKYLAKTRSGGFVDDKIPTSNTISQSLKKDAKSEVVPSKVPSNPVNQTNIKVSNNKTQTNVSITNLSMPSNSTQEVVTSNNYVRPGQAEKQVRQINIVPVVKGFRIPNEAQTQPSLTSAVTIKIKEPRLENSSSNTENKIIKPQYHRAFSTPSSFTSLSNKDKTKEKNIIKTFSEPSTNECSIPPPPPAMPVLKPVGERKNIKFLPPPEANPRDQLMLSIRSFSTDNLKKLTK